MAKKTAPLHTPEGRINQLISLAVDAAEERLKNGTASSQIITTLLNLGTEKTQLEMEKLRTDVKVGTAKVQQIKTEEEIAKKYDAAIKAMNSYRSDDYNTEDYMEDIPYDDL